MKNILSQFIPIIVIYLSLSYSNEFALFSHSVLGKLLAVFIIIYYTVLDRTIGLLICSVIIWYYQNEVVENMLNMDSLMNTIFNPEKVENEEDGEDEKKDTEHGIEGMQPINPTKNKELTTEETMSNIEKTYQPENRVATSFETTQKKDGYPVEFRKQYCDGNILKYKDMNVRGDMIEHVFPEVNYKKETCNPCTASCDFSIIENRMKTESQLIPKSSKDEKIM
jgi:hypothetical protein